MVNYLLVPKLVEEILLDLNTRSLLVLRVDGGVGTESDKTTNQLGAVWLD